MPSLGGLGINLAASDVSMGWLGLFIEKSAKIP